MKRTAEITIETERVVVVAGVRHESTPQPTLEGDMMSTAKTMQHTTRTFETVRIRRYFVGGKESDKKDLAAQPFIVAGAGQPDEAHGFADEAALCRWAAGTRHAELFARAIGTMKLGQQLEGTDAASVRALRRIEAAAERVRVELHELSRETGLPVGSPEFLDELASQSPALRVLSPVPVLFDKVFDSGSGIEPPVFGGSFFPVVATIPTFFGFNDKAGGAFVPGVLTLHDKTFFRGAAAFLFGLPFTNYILSDLAFDNRAASGIAL